MASAALGESNNPYGGLGTGGKFRKPTTRRSKKTPYDRPPTSVRISRLGGGEDRGGSWLSKLMDPAQRLINYSAHRLFASVFRKRLVSGETPLQSPEQKQVPCRDIIQETKVGHKENTSALSMKNDMEDTSAFVHPTSDKFKDLEKILKEKTFTRSEVDRLTTFLRSRTADLSTVNGEQGNEVNVVRHLPSHERHPDNGNMNALTPIGNSMDLDECIASPAQIAKAYMDSRPSEVTPMLGLRSQVVREDSVFLNRTPFPSKSRTMSLVPKLSGQRPSENGFVTPRSLGRSSVYSTARTPYFRPQSTVKASPSVWERLSSGSRQGFQSGLKRRSSVLDYDIGSVSPIRRLRQKANLSSRRLALPASESPLSVSAITHTSKNNGDIHCSSFNLVPSKSSVMASKILQQLDKLVSPGEKSPSKLSPSMLRGPALKSLENVEAPKFWNNLPEKKTNSPGSSYQKQETSRECGIREVLTQSEKTGSSKDQETSAKGVYLPLMNSLEEHPPKKRAFCISRHEDLFELDDDLSAVSTPFEVAEKQNAFKVEKGVGISMPEGEKPLTSSVTVPSTSYISKGDAFQGTSNGSLETGKGKLFVLHSNAVQQSNMVSEPTSMFIQETEKSSTSPSKLSSEEKVISLEEPKKADVFPNFFSSPAATNLSNQNTGVSSDIKFEKTSSSAFGVLEASANPTESKKTVSDSAFGAESTTSAASTLNGSILSDNSVSEVPSTVQSRTATPTIFSVFGKLPASNDSNSGNNSQSTSAPPLSSTTPFKFGEPATTVSASSGQDPNETEVKNSTFGTLNTFKFGGMASGDMSTNNVFPAKSSEIKTTPGFVFGNSSPTVADAGGTSSVVNGSTLIPSAAASESSGSLTFGATSSSTPTGSISLAFTSSGSNMFGGVAASATSGVFGFNAVSSASAASSQSQASNLSGAANAQTSNTGNATATSPFQFTPPASAPSFAMSGNNSSFGTNWQAPNSTPVFSSSFTTSSPTFSFGGSSAATGSTTSASIFSPSTNMPSSSPIFGFNSTAPTTPQQPVFGNSAPGFAFGATASPPNSQQVSTEDNMVEDTDQANKTSMTQPMFGQPSTPQPSFVFGGAPVMPPPQTVVNPFQFGGQPIASTPPFQASNCGNFSVGSTGGGDKTGRRIFKPKKTNRKK